MNRARPAAVVTWVYGAAFGIPAIPVAIYLVQRGGLPSFYGLFDMYGGPWSARFTNRTLLWLLMGFLAVTLVPAWAAWLVWKGSRAGAILNLALLPIEAVFWVGFALPLPWLLGAARAVLLIARWKSLEGHGQRVGRAGLEPATDGL